MRPFADEATIKGPLCGKEGDSWHEQILLASLNEGMTLNGYSTSLYLPQAELDCFVGGLVAVGIAPQMLGNGRPDQLARAKFWLDLYKTHGMATESTIDALHYPNIFLVGLRGGTASTPSYGLLVGASVGVPIPGTLGDNATVLTYQGVDASSINLTIPATTNSGMRALGCRNARLTVHSHVAAILVGTAPWMRRAGDSSTTRRVA